MDATDLAFEQERSFIARCSDVHAMLDRMADYRDSRRIAVSRGDTKARLRSGDLLELAEDRIAELKSRRHRQVAHSSSAPRQQRCEPVEPRRAPPPQNEPGRRASPEPSPRPFPEPDLPHSRDARSRHGRKPHRAQSGLVKMQAELKRAQDARLREERLGQEANERAEEARQATMRLARLKSQLRQEREGQQQAARERRAAEQRAEEKEHQAKAQAARLERALAQHQQREDALQRQAQPGPKETTGAQVQPTEVKAVPEPDTATEVTSPPKPEAQQPTPLPNETTAPPAKPEAPSRPTPRHQLVPPQEASPPAVPHLAQESALIYTGADLVRFRSEHTLTQRAAAEKLGVAHGTIAKAEIVPTKPLGPTLQQAISRITEP